MTFRLDDTLEVLARVPASVHALLSGLPPDWVRANEGPDTFSPFDVVGHLVDGEETDWVPRARIILSRAADPVFEPYDRFRHRSRNAGRTLDSLLEEFATRRRANLGLVRSWNLGEPELSLPGRHPSLGPVTLRELLAAWAVHDLGHVAQIARVLAKRHRDDVGPWTPFLPVLTDHETPRS